MTQTSIETPLSPRIEVLEDLETIVDELMQKHQGSRKLWFPSDLLAAEEQEDRATFLAQLQKRAEGLPDSCRISILLGLITEEGLPHFHRQLAVYLGDDSFWQRWNNLWTAEEDRHGAVLSGYCRDSQILHIRSLENVQFEYLRIGFLPQWERDPYRLFVYTSLQERATQFSHANTGKLASEYEPCIGNILFRIAGDEARHCAFYRQIFAEILKRDPNQALESAAEVMPSIDMPGVGMPHFREFAEIVRRAGIYGPRDYLRIVEETISVWKIESMVGLNEIGRKAQEKILDIPRRLKRVADYMESRTTAKSFSFDLIFNRKIELGVS